MAQENAPTGEPGRTSTGKAARLQQDATTGPNAVGTGKVLGSKWTDTKGTEQGHGPEGKTPVVGDDGNTYFFAPLLWDDQDEASLELQRLPTTLLALGMVNPFGALEDVTSAQLAGMTKVLAVVSEVSEYQACSNVALLCFNLTKEQRAAFARLIWYGFRRHHPDIEEVTVRRLLSPDNMVYFMRLHFRKNLGVLDRFLSRITELMPDVPERTAEDEATAEPVTPQELKDYLSAVSEVAETTGPEETIPDEATPEEAARQVVQTTQTTQTE